MSNKYPGGIITSGANAGYSVAFDGTGDYLSCGSQSAYALGTGNFTVEAWVYVTSRAAEYNIASTRASSGTVNGWSFAVATGGGIVVYTDAFVFNNVGTVPLNTWTHVAFVREGTGTNQTKIYINGTSVASATNSQNFSNTTLAIGAANDGSQFPFLGNISNFRIVKGTALYTAAFTPPTQLLNVTNTSLLTCNSPAIVDQSSNNFTITANGNAAVSTFTPFTGTQLVPNPNTLANTQGVWSISDAAYWMSQNKWPMPPNYPLQSLRFNSADTTYLTRTPSVTGNQQKFTFSGWVKRSLLSSGEQCIFNARAGAGTPRFRIFFNTNDTLQQDSDNFGQLTTTQVFRDPSAWYHIVFAADSTQATSTERKKLYVNGVQVTVFNTSTYPTQNTNSSVNSTVAHDIGVELVNAIYFNGYMADINFVDGQQLTPSSFGANDPNTGVWSPVPYSGTYGTNGFRLSFQNNTGTTATTLGRDYSGNGNNWTPNNFSVAAGSGNDSLTDGPTNWGIDYGNGGEVRGNYATLNPLNPTGGTFSNGNLDWTSPAVDQRIALSTMEINGSSKWYCEFTIGTKTGTYWHVGVFGNPTIWNPRLLYRSDGARWIDNTSQTPNWASYTTGDIIGISYDGTTGAATFYKNGALLGSMTTPTPTASQYFGCASDGSGGTMNYSVNFGQRPFAYPAPPGFKVLCTTNLPIPAVGATSTTLANKYFDATLYTGTGSALTVTNAGSFQPDLVWYKDRSAASSNALFDAIRGATAYLSSDSTAAEQTISGVTAFNSNGFSLGTNAGGNFSGRSYVGWQWNAGGSTVTNTSGSISSQVRANPTAGISVVTYTIPSASATIETFGHGLGRAPSMVILKVRGNVDEWTVYNANLTTPLSNWLTLNTTAAAGGSTSTFSSSSTTFGVRGTRLLGSGTSGNIVAYCFAEIAGFSRFGSYTGNGSADGTFVYTGFRPRYVMIKRTDAAGSNWYVLDSVRNTYNVANSLLRPNLADAEVTGVPIDFLSNGFKLRDADSGSNGSGGTFIFAAFAESPFNYSRAR